MTDNDEGSILGGHRARRKSSGGRVKSARLYVNYGQNILGGPEMYTVARRAFTAGLPGKRIEKILDVKLVVGGLVARLCSLRDSTNGQL